MKVGWGLKSADSGFSVFTGVMHALQWVDYCAPPPDTEWDPVAATCVVANPADINLDACVNVSDLLQVLYVFGQCFDASLAATTFNLVSRYRLNTLKVVGLVLLRMVK